MSPGWSGVFHLKHLYPAAPHQSGLSGSDVVPPTPINPNHFSIPIYQGLLSLPPSVMLLNVSWLLWSVSSKTSLSCCTTSIRSLWFRCCTTPHPPASLLLPYTQLSPFINIPPSVMLVNVSWLLWSVSSRTSLSCCTTSILSLWLRCCAPLSKLSALLLPYTQLATLPSVPFQ